MPNNPTRPGVYIQEVPSGVRTISGVNTSIALIVGCANQGPINTPTKCRSFADYERTFASDNSLSEMSLQAKLFFANSGSRCYVIRLANAADSAGPGLADYEAAFQVANTEIDLFNLILLPRNTNPVQPMHRVYALASVLCQRKRAFLLMDAPQHWADVHDARNGVDDLRVGLVNDHAAVFYPDVTIKDGEEDRHIGAAGAIAGIIARTDSTRGVWKAPAGTDAVLRGVLGLKNRFSDDDIGVLNVKAVNVIRILSRGVVNWGARTMDGDDSFASEYKYISVRRLALHIEESLYRGLAWAVFEPNDEPLWSQMRMNVTAFMHALYRNGAFQGSKPRDAYFVKCDKETTTQADQGLGVVNIHIGFAPLKPAEFVILPLQLEISEA